MNKIEIIKLLIKNEFITTKELTELGFNSHMISKLVGSGFIARKERGIYTYGSIKSILDYGIELLEAKDKVNSKLLFDYCYKIDPNNYDVNVSQLYASVLLGKNEEVFKYFTFIYNYLKNNNREKDAYYYLFLYSFCYDVPNCFIEDYKKFLKSNIRAKDSDNNDLREFVYTIDFNSAKKAINSGKFSFEDSYEFKLEKVLVFKGHDVFYRKNNYIKQNIENGNYYRVKDYLENRDDNELLSYSQKYLLYIINAYLHTNLTGEILKEKEVSNDNNFYLCIESNQFDLAKKILDKYYSSNTDDNKDNNVFYIVLSQYVELIDSLKYEARKKELLTLDNIISMIVDGDYSLIDEYLVMIEKSEYSFLIKDFIKLAELNNNNLFIITTLISISTGNYKFNINNFVSLYLNALQNKDFDRAKIYLDIISKSSHISSIDIEKCMTKIFMNTVTNNCFDKSDDSVLETDINKSDDESYDNVNSDDENNEIDDDTFDNEEVIQNSSDVNSFESRIRTLLNNLNEDKPIVLLPTVSSEDEMDLIFDIIYSDYPNISVFAINTADGSQAVARYKVELEEFIDFKELFVSAKNDYHNHNYQDALIKYRQLLTVGNPHPGIYGAYGLCLRNAGKKEEAIEALKIATGYSKIKDGGKLDYSSVIFDLTHPRYKDSEYEKKPYVDVKDYDPDRMTFGVDMGFIEELIQLVKDGEVSFDEAIEKLDLSEIDRNYARLIYARDCYYVAAYEIGDKYFRIVEKSKEKNEKIMSLLEEIRKNKRFYQNRLDEERKKLVLIK